MIRRRVIVAWSALGILLLGILGVAAVIGATQTGWGRSRIRGLVAVELRRAVHGHVYLGALHGNLLTELTIDSLEIRAPDGQLLVATGSVHAEYDPRDLWDRRVLLERLDVEHPYVQLIHYRDGSWNYSKLFPPTPRSLPRTSARGFGDYLVAQQVAVHNGVFVYSNRWSPDDSLRGARRDSVIREALGRPHFGLNRTPMGLMRTLAWTGIQVSAPLVRIADPDSSGPSFQIARLDVDEFFPPFRFSHVEGRIHVVHDSLWATLRHVELPGTAGRGGGKVWWGSDRPLTLALHFDTDSISLADIAWVYPTLPRTGGGRATVDIRSDRAKPEIVDYIVRSMDLRTTGSRLVGSLTFESGRRQLVIKDVATELEPVDFALIKVLAGGKPFPIDWVGQWTGQVRGPGGLLSRFRADTVDLTLHDGHVSGATTRLAGSGELDVSNPSRTAFHHFRLTVNHLDLRTPQFVLPNFPRLRGVIRGTATLDSAWNDVRFADADLTHIDGAGSPSRILGSGRFTLGEGQNAESVYDMSLQAQPLSFTTLAASYPALGLHGEFSGPVTLQGALSNLDLTAHLTGAPGVLAVDGHFSLVRPGWAGSGAVRLVHADLRSLTGNDSLPQTDLSMRADADLRGDSLAGLDGPVTATVAQSDIGQVELDTGRFVGRFGGQRLRVDTLSVESPGGSLSAGGGLSLVPTRSDSLGLAFALDSLGGWRRFLTSDTAAQAMPGSIRLGATVRGWLDSLSAAGTLQGSGIRMGRLSARGVSGTFNLASVKTPPRGTASIGFDGVGIAGLALDHVGLTSQFLGGGLTELEVTSSSPTGARFTAASEIRQARDTVLMTLKTLTVAARRDTLQLVAPAHVLHTAAGLSVDRLALRSTGAAGGSVAVLATANLPHEGPISARIQADSVPLADIGELLESSAAYGGWFSLDWAITGERLRPIMRADARLVSGQFGDVRLEKLLAHAAYQDRRLQLHGDLVQRGDTTLHALVSVPANLALEPGVPRLLSNDSLRGNIRADSVQFGALATIYPTLQNPKGSFVANVNIGGTLGHPKFSGGMRLTDAEAGFPRLGVRFVGMNADLRLLGDSLAVRDISASSVDGQRRGRATLQGWVTAADLKNPRFDLVFRASELHALSSPRVADVAISTVRPLELVGRLSGSTLTGAVSVDRGAIYIPDITQKNVVSLDDPEFFSLVDTSLFQNRLLLPEAPTRLLQDLTLDNVQVTLGNEVWLKSSEANINLSTSQGPLRVTTASTGRDSTKGLALAGSLIAERGDYRLNLGIVQRTFTVEQGGTVRFTNEVNINPDLNISALYTVRQARTNAGNNLPDLRIRVLLAGTLEHPRVALSSAADSSLQLSQSDLLSYLVTGQQSFAVGQGGTDNYQTATSFFLPTLATALGSRLSGGLFEQINISTATTYVSNSSGNNVLNALGQTRIGAGKQFGRTTFVSADLGVCGLGTTAAGQSAPPTASQIGVRIEQQLTQRFSLSASSEPGTFGLYCAQGALSRSFVDTPRQWGLDLFHSWQF